MAYGRPRWVILFWAGVVVPWLGCQQANQPAEKLEPAQPSAQDASSGESAGQATETANVEPAQPEPPPPPKIPEVHLPEQLAKTSLVGVGDTMPPGEVTSLEGSPLPLNSVYGEKLTVVFFWKGEDLYSQMAAVDALQFLEEDVIKSYAGKGVQVVAINVREAPSTVRQRLNEAKTSFPNFRDPEGAYFAKVATERLPRIYLLDGQGKILWFDLEYSRTTRTQLMRAIQVVLGEPPVTTP